MFLCNDSQKTSKRLQKVKHWLTYSYTSLPDRGLSWPFYPLYPFQALHCLSQSPSSQKPKHSHPAEGLPCLFFILESCLIAPQLTCQPSPSLAMLKFCLHVFCVLIRFQKHRQVFEHISCVSVLAQAFSITFPQSEELLHNVEDSYSPGLYICNSHQRDHGWSISRPH